MPDNWETYKEWKELMENIRKRPQDDEVYTDDDNIEDFKELYEEYRP